MCVERRWIIAKSETAASGSTCLHGESSKAPCTPCARRIDERRRTLIHTKVIDTPSRWHLLVRFNLGVVWHGLRSMLLMSRRSWDTRVRLAEEAARCKVFRRQVCWSTIERRSYVIRVVGRPATCSRRRDPCPRVSTILISRLLRGLRDIVLLGGRLTLALRVGR